MLGIPINPAPPAHPPSKPLQAMPPLPPGRAPPPRGPPPRAPMDNLHRPPMGGGGPPGMRPLLQMMPPHMQVEFCYCNKMELPLY